TYRLSSYVMNPHRVTCQNASAVAMMRSREMMSWRFLSDTGRGPGVDGGEGLFRDVSLRPALFCMEAFQRKIRDRAYCLGICPVMSRFPHPNLFMNAIDTRRRPLPARGLLLPCQCLRPSLMRYGSGRRLDGTRP